MIPDLDIYRAAGVIMKRYGNDAQIHAALRADAMLGYSVCSSVDACA